MGLLDSARGSVMQIRDFSIMPAVTTTARALRQTIRSTNSHQCPDAAAAMAFDFVFALFPGILVVTGFLSILEISVEDFARLVADLGIVAPGPLAGIVTENMQHVLDSSESFFFIGILGVLWPASASMSTTMNALNRAYEADESRSFWSRRILSIILILTMGVIMVFLFNLIAFSEQVEHWLRVNWLLSTQMPSLAGLVRRVAGTVGALVVAAVIYRIGPNVSQRWLDVLPGSLLFFGLWSLIAAGFGYFVGHFGYYHSVHGLLAGVILLLLSAYLVAFTLLLGGELNASLIKVKTSSRAS